jgi:tetratricopeptide (TPR) repeat protein
MPDSTERQMPPGPSVQQINQLTALYRQGRFPEALLEGEELAQRFPDASIVHYVLGVVYVAVGRSQQAVASYALAVTLNPGFAEAHYNLGGVLDGLGKTRDAIVSYGNAIKCRPNYAKAHSNLGACLLDLGLLEPAATSFRQAIQCQADLSEAHNNLGHVLDRLKIPEQAVISCRRAIEIRPGYADAHNNLGNALLHLGQLEEAEASYRKAVELRPDYAEAHQNLSAIRSYQPDDPHIGQLQRLIERPGVSTGDRMLIHFALGNAYHASASFDHAFAHYQEGNRLQKPQRNHDRAATRARVRKIVSAFSDGTPVIESSDNRPAPAAQQPIFIVGMPRSGTSLVEQILASHSELYGAGELELLDRAMAAAEWDVTPISPDQLRKIRDRYLEGIASICAAKAFVTDKMPFNFWWIGYIVAALPEARIVHVTRDARAICWSNFRHYYAYRGITFTNDFGDLADYYSIYTELMAFWHDRYPGLIYDLNYESLTENQADETRRLLQHLGLPWQDQCLEFHLTRRAVQTASAAQVRSGMYRGSSDAWREYADRLGPMIELLKDY